MATYELTVAAESEIEDIYDYSIANFGLSVARDYLMGLHVCCQLLAEHQSFGTDYSFIMPKLRRYEYRSHSIYGSPGLEVISKTNERSKLTGVSESCQSWKTHTLVA
jgi:toxin ParE1/3/4